MAKSNTEDAISKDIPKEPVLNGVEPQKKIKGFVSVFPGKDHELPDELTELLISIKESLGNNELWLLKHDGDDETDLGWLSPEIWKSFYESEVNNNKPINLIIESPGGDAPSAYRIAKFLKNTFGSFNAIIPREAKSAATLLALGAEKIFMGKEADLGPLDVQITDTNEERSYSALDEVQAIDGLFDFATNQILHTTGFWAHLMKKKRQNVFPLATKYVVGMMRPLMEKIDTVHYMSLSRSLLIAEEYAFRLLLDKCGELKAKMIARGFVKNYPYHGFIIDINEAKKLGLTNVTEIPSETQKALNTLLGSIGDEMYLIGHFYTKEI